MNNLGSRLKEIRTRAGMSLRELARQANVSPSLVSQIENGKSQPSVATLYAFSQLLNVSVDELFDSSTNGGAPHAPDDGAEPETERDGWMNPTRAWHPSEYANRVSVVHPAHRPRLAMADGVVWERLTATPEHDVNFMKISYEPGATSTAGGDLVSHAGYEYGFVLSGQLDVTIGEELFHLHAGESLGFDSVIPHVLHNPGPEPFEGIWFVHGGRH
ncbi:MAG TPA: helix-turn-helix domain-containing protein [Amnibacterium sp.]|uniref:helix-turn-helix domain-containing protein n=1 Tax=Amnibacterium sp. TaxID=1872496 RepID=UPI002F925438